MARARRQNLPEGIRSGRRFAVDIEQPRDKTAGLMVSEAERNQIDIVAAHLGRTRSSFLTMMAVAFVEDCLAGGEPEKLLSFYEQCRSAVHGSSESPKNERK